MLDIVIDSSVIIEIIKNYKKNLDHPRNVWEKRVFKIKDLIETGRINPIITPTIKREIDFGSKFDGGIGENYIRKYFTLPKFNEYMHAKTLIVADGYGNYPIGDNEEYAIANAEDYIAPKYNEAKIIAEVSVLQKMTGKTIPIISINECNQNNINFINSRHNVPDVHICTLRQVQDAIKIAQASEQTSEN